MTDFWALPQDLPPEHQPEQGDANTALALETEAYDERIGGFVMICFLGVLRKFGEKALLKSVINIFENT